MGDIDFDELDKAVNSLMSSADAPKSPKKAEATGRQHISKSASAIHRRHTPAQGRPSSVVAKPTQKPAAKAMDLRSTPSKAAKPTPAVRRGGRFMDVVDSSSELNPIRKPLTLPPRESSRKFEQSGTGSVTQSEPEQLLPASVPAPTQDLTRKNEPILEVSYPTSVVPEPEKVEQVKPASEPIQVRLVAKSAPVPEPLQLLQEDAAPTSAIEILPETSSDDEARPSGAFGIPVSNKKSDAAKTSLAATPELEPVETSQEPALPTSLSELVGGQGIPKNDEPVVAVRVASPSVLEPKREKPDVSFEANDVIEDKTEENESPFLVDAKIEKRPLNANQVVTNDATPVVAAPSPVLVGSAEQLAEEPVNEPDPMPTIPHEQPEVADVPELASDLVALEATGKATYELDETPVPIKSSTDGSLKLATHPKSDKPTGPTSISQQYQAKESSGDPSHAPIYDASEYADPVAHPAKKKSGWVWVLAIFLLLALGSGGAVALYVTGIIP